MDPQAMPHRAREQQKSWCPKLRIYLVGFPERRLDREAESLANMICDAAPEAAILEHTYARHNDVPTINHTTPWDNAAESPVGGRRHRSPSQLTGELDFEEGHATTGVPPVSDTPDSFSPSWITSEAHRLLERVQSEMPSQAITSSRKVLFVAYGLGGVVVKKAIIMANTDPRFYDVAFNTNTLIFFAVPHQPKSHKMWEELASEMIKAAFELHSRPLSSFLAGLVGSMPHISYTFYQLAAKYRITNIILDGTLKASNTQHDNSLGVSVEWPRSEKDGLARLEILCRAIAPSLVASNPVEGETEPSMYDNYFQTLQVLSPTRRVIYENRTLDECDDQDALRKIYFDLIGDITWEKSRGRTIQVTASKGYGKSAIVRLICQKIQQEASVVTIHNSPRDQTSLYSTMVSVIHQIISQRPTLFPSIHPLLIEMLRHNVWVARSVEHILYSIFLCSEGVDFMIVIHNFDSPLWSQEVRDWWLKIPVMLKSSDHCTCTFLISNDQLINNPTSQQWQHIDLEAHFSSSRRRAFIIDKTSQLLECFFTSASPKSQFYETAKDKIIQRATNFQGSFSDVNALLVHLFEGLVLSSRDEILRNINRSPLTSTELHESHFTRLKRKDPMVFSWAKNILAWLRLAVRPLRVEELAVAMAIVPGQQRLREVSDAMPINLEGDIRIHLNGLVSIANGYVYIAKSSVEHTLAEHPTLNLADDSILTFKCVSYLRLVLQAPDEENVWRNCLSHVSVRHRMEGRHDPTLEFLDYATRYWPKHFQRVQGPTRLLITAVVDFLLSTPMSGRWFRLYLLCNGLSHHVLGDGQRVSIEPKSAPDDSHAENFPNTTTLSPTRNPSSTVYQNSATLWTPDQSLSPSPLEMASFAGLSHILPDLLGIHDHINEANIIHIGRGSFQNGVLVGSMPVKYYLECAISIDDSTAVEVLLATKKDTFENYFPIHMAALMGSPNTIQLLRRPGNIGDVDQDGRTVLHMAAISGEDEIIDILVEDVEKKKLIHVMRLTDNNEETPLLLATRMGNLDAVRRFISLGESKDPTPTIRDSKGNTPAHHAALYCTQALLQLLSQQASNDTDPEAIRNNERMTPLHIAATHGRTKAVLSILEATRAVKNNWDMIESEDNEGNTPLHCAIQHGFDDVADILIREGEKSENAETLSEIAAEVATKHGNLPVLKKLEKWTSEIKERLLSEAISAGQLLITKYLLQGGAEPNGETDTSHTPLGLAASKGHKEVVRTLLIAKASPNLPNVDRQTPLHLAVKHGQEEITQILLEHNRGLDGTIQSTTIDAPDMLRWTPLHFSARNGNVRIMEMLLDARANVEAHSVSLETPLHVAVLNPEAVKTLVTAGAQVNSKNARGRTPLHEAMIHKNIESIRLLLKAGADPICTDDERRRPAYYGMDRGGRLALQELFQSDYPKESLREDIKDAIELSDSDIFKFLLREFPDIAATPDRLGWSLLHTAAEMNLPDILELLLVEFKMDVNQPGHDQNTPLYLASSRGNIHAMRTLISNGANVNQTALSGHTPLHAAVYRSDPESCKVLLENGALINSFGNIDETPLFTACWQGNFQVVQTLLEKGADVHLYATNCWSPLHAAADRPDICEILINEGANIDCQKNDGWTPMHLAVGWGYEDVVGFLLRKGANPNIANKDNDMPLHTALQKDRHEILKLMANHQGQQLIDFNIRGAAGQAPVHIATRSAKSIKILMKKGVDFKVKADNGLSCLDLAIDRGDVDALNVLLTGNDSGGSVPDWDRQDLVSAYWRAIQRSPAESRCLAALLEKGPFLANEISEVGLNGLDTYMCTMRGTTLEELAPLVLLDVGINPFEATTNRKSAFELGVESNHGGKVKFLERCFAQLTNYSQKRNLSFEEFRVAIELSKRSFLAANRFFKKGIDEKTDNDGWTIDQIIHQSEPRLGISWLENKVGNNKTRKPTSFQLDLHAHDRVSETYIQMFDDGLQVIFEGTSEIPRGLRSDFAFPPINMGLPYFEVTMQSVHETSTSLSAICIGLIGEFSDRESARPGGSIWSLGYHGDDGNVYEEGAPINNFTGHVYGPGNVVGCGISYSDSGYLFTLDGKVVAKHSSEVIYRKMYPYISHNSGHVRIMVNFGQTNFEWSDAESLTSNMEEPVKVRVAPSTLI